MLSGSAGVHWQPRCQKHVPKPTRPLACTAMSQHKTEREVATDVQFQHLFWVVIVRKLQFLQDACERASRPLLRQWERCDLEGDEKKNGRSRK